MTDLSRYEQALGNIILDRDSRITELEWMLDKACAALGLNTTLRPSTWMANLERARDERTE